MKALEIVGAGLSLIGFCILLPWENFTNFSGWIRHRVDVYANFPPAEKNPKWDEKVKPFVGWLSLTLGSIINLIVVIFKR